MLKKLILLAFFLMANAYSVNSAATSATLVDSLLYVPHAKLPGGTYALIFQMNNSVIPATFSLKSYWKTSYTENGISGHTAYYTKTSKTLTVPELHINNKVYSLSLQGDFTTKKFTLTQFGLSVPSFLFATTMQKATFKNSGSYGGGLTSTPIIVGPHILVTGNPAVTIFSDRPFRIARPMKAGLVGFTKLYAKSDFVNDPPNTTFTGTNVNGKMVTTIMEMGKPFIAGTNIILPITRFVGEQPALTAGAYSNVTMVVDNFWGWVGAIGGTVGTIGACTVGETLTLGLDTPGCIGAAIGTVAAWGSLI